MSTPPPASPAPPQGPSARRLLRDVFGFHEYRPDQEEIVDHLVAGGDAFVLMPTGGGKSLCYQLPALVRPGTGIVVSPLISLMKDQVDALRAAGVSAAAYNSSLDGAEARQVLARLHDGRLDLLYVAPETLMTPSFLARLHGLEHGGIALIAIDEAHCVSQWGHDFRPEYVQLGELRGQFPGVPITGLHRHRRPADARRRAAAARPRRGARVRHRLRPAQHPLHRGREARPAAPAPGLPARP